MYVTIVPYSSGYCGSIEITPSKALLAQLEEDRKNKFDPSVTIFLHNVASIKFMGNKEYTHINILFMNEDNGASRVRYRIPFYEMENIKKAINDKNETITFNYIP